MISFDKIRQLAVKYQTTELNVVREYFQNLFLNYFYQQSQSGSVYFKGGTALRILWNSPRFSEDLDFSVRELKEVRLERIILEALARIERENITVLLQEAKTTSGGYLAKVTFKASEFSTVMLQLEISSRQEKLKGDAVTVVTDYIPAFIVNSLNQELLVDEKIQALLSRKKARDFYDLYFILRSNLLPPAKKDVLPEILSVLKSTEINFEKELKVFLPKTHWPIVKGFKSGLEKEIQKFI